MNITSAPKIATEEEDEKKNKQKKRWGAHWAMYYIFNSGVDNSNHHNNRDTFHASAQDKKKTLMKRVELIWGTKEI